MSLSSLVAAAGSAGGAIAKLKEPGPEVTTGGVVTDSDTALHVCTEKTAAREVVTDAGTLLKLTIGVS
jgi:hypothetical protein